MRAHSDPRVIEFIHPESLRMRRPLRLALALIVTAPLSGCGLWLHYLNSSSQLVGAQPLEAVTDRNWQGALDTAEKGSDSQKIAFLGKVVIDSKKKCDSFLNQLVVAENTVNTTGDIISTTLTAAATVFSPMTTVHGLTAGSTVVTGAKTSVNANVYAKATIANFSTALVGSYYKNIAEYNDALPKISNIAVSVEINKIQSIHSTCTLAAAESAIQTTISPSAQPPAAPTNVTATPYDSAVTLSWDAVSGALTYDIFQGSTAGKEASTPAVSGISTTTSTMTGLQDGNPYFFKVTARNGVGVSPQSVEVSATPLAAAGVPPAPPANQPLQTHSTVPGQSLLLAK